MKSWITDINDLSRIAAKEPQLAYSAYIYGTSKRWNYVCRTTPDISQLLKPLEYTIKETFIPAVIGRSYIDQTFRDIMSLPSKLGGMSIPNVSEISDIEYNNSITVTEQLTEAIIEQANILELDYEAIKEAKCEISDKRLKFYQQQKQDIISKTELQPENTARLLELASEKGVSCWLTSLPLKSFGFSMTKQEFHDAIALRYNFKISNVSGICFCNEKNSINHSLVCKKGGYVNLRHNSMRDTIAELLTPICYDVVTEPPLLELAGSEDLPRGTILSPEARLDISARSFWSPMDKIYTDVRIFHPHAPSNAKMEVTRMYKHHEDIKKRAYLHRVQQIEKGSFTPLVFSTTGGVSGEADKFFRRLAEKMTQKKLGSSYSDNISFIRRRLRFDLLRTTLISLRGYRGKRSDSSNKIEELDLNLEPKARSEM